ncbi:hypothetical protein BU23DRAFT_597213 [Bimuria novae-zelandiae CBS 107.79]|uniref:TLDc domain-containing protein n=1 Tax=Bimuria novae-zelandiae CBS 107.79 TaxID=1447943 RepID=A0A6A5VN42_9PLEO|nr:hypothetical protein BU23DRAFT_597213 [Bimuria novae-zelandiae CBS 107.79]
MPAPPTQEWLAKQYHSGRFDLLNAHVLHDNEQEALTKAFDDLAIEISGVSRVKRTSLVSHIQSQLPRDLPTVFADHLYRMLVYLSTAPLYRAPDAPLPGSLSVSEIQHALAWLLPGRQLYMSETGNMGRMRTPADGRRLLFQSLAERHISTPESPNKEAARRDYAHRNAFDMEYAKKFARSTEYLNSILTEWCKINRDDDGDEMFHDVLDVLHKNVPDNFPYGSKRDDLRPLAKELKADFELHNLAIPRVDLKEFVRALLILQIEQAEHARSSLEPAASQSFDEAAASVMATFACDDKELAAAFPEGQDLVAWPAFDQGLKQIAHLFDPLYRVVIDVFLDGHAADTDIVSLYEVPPELQTGQQTQGGHYILSVSWLTLTCALLPALVDLDDFHTVVRWYNRITDVKPDSDAIWAHVRPQVLKEGQDRPATTVLAFSCQDQASGGRFKAGVMVAVDYDRNRGRDLLYSLHIFQLAPSARYAKLLGQTCQKESDTRLVFGDASQTQAPYRIELHMEKMEAKVEALASGQSHTIKLDALEVWKDGE